MSASYGKFIVFEQPLSDGSTVYDVAFRGPAGHGCTIHNCLTERQAADLAADLNAAVLSNRRRHDDGTFDGFRLVEPGATFEQANGRAQRGPIGA